MLITREDFQMWMVDSEHALAELLHQVPDRVRSGLDASLKFRRCSVPCRGCELN
jgi:hypothetical protein